MPPFVPRLGGWNAPFCVMYGMVMCHLLCQIWDGGMSPLNLAWKSMNSFHLLLTKPLKLNQQINHSHID